MLTKYILKRLLLAIVTFIVIYVIVYLIMAKFGNNPFVNTVDAIKSKSTDASEQLIKLQKENGFDKPAVVRLWDYTVGIFHGDYGKIYKSSETSIPALFFKPLRYTILVSLPSFIISVILGVILGTISAYKRGKWQDASITSFATVFVALPSFVLAPFIILIALKINLPFEFKDAEDYSVGTMITSLIPPIVVFVLSSIARYTFLVRNWVVTTLSSHQVLIAKAKGLSKFKIFTKHVFRNASIPLVRTLIFSYLALLSGSIILEQFFRIPGSSTIIVNAIQDGEINVSMFSLIFFTSLSLVTDIVADLSYVFMDPRISIASKSERNYWVEFKKWRSRKQSKEKLEQGEMSNV